MYRILIWTAGAIAPVIIEHEDKLAFRMNLDALEEQHGWVTAQEGVREGLENRDRYAAKAIVRYIVEAPPGEGWTV